MRRRSSVGTLVNSSIGGRMRCDWLESSAIGNMIGGPPANLLVISTFQKLSLSVCSGATYLQISRTTSDFGPH